jgi:DNA-binding beta-propeller fold protein YncE
MPSVRCRIPKAAIPALLLLALTFEAQAQYVLDSIDVGGRFVGCMCSNPRGNLIYGLGNTDNFVFAIDCSSNQVVARVDAYYPRWVTYDSADGKLYCTFGLGEESLLVMDGVTLQPIRVLPLSGASLMAWDPIANRLFVSCTDADRVSVVDCVADTVITHIRTSPEPLRMHLNTRHRKLYVQCHGSERLNIMDLNTLEVIENIRVPGYPEAGCYSEAVDKYYGMPPVRWTP